MTDTNTSTVGQTPTDTQLAARRKRNIAIGLSLAAFMVFVFFSMLARVGAI